MQTPLVGLRPTGVPALRVNAGRASPLPSLSLTGITGVIAPPPAGVPGPQGGLVIDLRGSYGGAQETLWTAKGRADLEANKGTLALRAEQFSLGRIKDVLPRSVLAPDNTTHGRGAGSRVGGRSDPLRRRAGGRRAVAASRFAGRRADRKRVARADDEGDRVSRSRAAWSWSAPRRASATSRRGCRAASRCRRARSSSPTARPGTWSRRSRSAFTVPKVPCAKLLTSIPPALLPRLQGFVLQGNFAADVGAKIDYANLEALELHGQDRHRRLQGRQGAARGAGAGRQGIAARQRRGAQEAGRAGRVGAGRDVGDRRPRQPRLRRRTRRSRRICRGRS